MYWLSKLRKIVANSIVNSIIQVTENIVEKFDFILSIV